jgi:CheY-like chemotaxis protein
MKILIVEDEQILLNSLVEKFSEENFEVLTATNGIDGLDKALKHHPDIILLDILMPKMNGLTALKKLRLDTWGSHAKVVILTNVNDNEKIAEAMKAGLNSSFIYLLKTDQTLESIFEEVKKIIEKQ